MNIKEKLPVLGNVILTHGEMSLPDDSVDIFQKSIVDRYATRSKTLEHMCHADFASQYVTGSNTEQDNSWMIQSK